MDPLDAAVLREARAHGSPIDGGKLDIIAAALHVARDPIEISIENLIKLGIMAHTHRPTSTLTAFGRDFFACGRLSRWLRVVG